MSELNGLPLFSTITSSSKELLDQGVICKEVPAATPVLHKGSQVSGAYVVLKGRLRVYSISPSGTEATLYTISPGETCILALNCLFNDFLYPAWVKSELKTKVAVVPGALYRKLFGVEPSIQEFTVNALSTVVFRLMNELEQVHFCRLEHRLANLILTRANSEGVLKATQKDIADNLGTTREVVTRIMREFALKDYIETHRGSVEIRNSEALADLIASNIDIYSLGQIESAMEGRSLRV